MPKKPNDPSFDGPFGRQMKSSDRDFPGQASVVRKLDAPKKMLKKKKSGVIREPTSGETRSTGTRGYERLGGGVGSYDPNAPRGKPNRE